MMEAIKRGYNQCTRTDNQDKDCKNQVTFSQIATAKSINRCNFHFFFQSYYNAKPQKSTERKRKMIK